MAVSELTFAGGALMGFAGSLHCAGMCGSIAAGLMFSFDGEGGTRGRIKALAAAHAGRVLAYATAGLVVGAIGTSVYAGLDRAGGYEIARLIAWPCRSPPASPGCCARPASAAASRPAPAGPSSQASPGAACPAAWSMVHCSTP